MKLPLYPLLVSSVVLLGACNKPVEVIQPVVVPGPTGPAGATGKPGEAGKTGTDTTVIVVPTPAASTPTQ
ncbi:MAG: hypothetical protein H7242_21955 [Microbacteriaceae bacterium]|nr:hypothetical protein [Burkholderiaceae bacterium]